MQAPRSTRILIMSIENHNSSALYEAWQFIARRAQLEVSRRSELPAQHGAILMEIYSI